MQKNTKKIRGAVICAIVFILIMAAYLATIIWALVCENLGGFGVVVIMGLYAGIVLAVIAGVCIALVQRIGEIKGGEETDAEKY